MSCVNRFIGICKQPDGNQAFSCVPLIEVLVEYSPKLGKNKIAASCIVKSMFLFRLS